ncbi:unnamed protein product [Cladocopium goreaui]|uniref:BTB domain-containing protein n=1 Tax=Cladocopium goreaui TaxID=2562237 RepID=A0A9P1GDC2_9DINO|nr:unnamed protein product [Cladocopium goreaui]
METSWLDTAIASSHPGEMAGSMMHFKVRASPERLNATISVAEALGNPLPAELSLEPQSGCSQHRFLVLGDMGTLQKHPKYPMLVGCDRHRIIALDCRTGAHQVLHESNSIVRISCLSPTSGDIIYSVIRNMNNFEVGADEREFFSLKLDDCLVDGFATARIPPRPLTLPQPHEEPFYGIAVERIIDLDNGSRIYLGDAETGTGMVHVGADGQLLMWSDDCEDHGLVLDVDAPANRFGLYDTEGYGVYMLSFESYETSVIAGDLQHWGTTDGVGPLARFWHLKRPMVSNRHLFMRTEGPAVYQWRQCCVDLKTLEVKTVYVVQNQGQALQLFVASLEGDEVQPTYRQFCGIDLAEAVSTVVFRLPFNKRLQIDRRILVARSHHFREILSVDQNLSEIDLSKEAAADLASFTVLLRFLMTDRWDATSSHVEPDLAFNVRHLAKTFRLPRLMLLAEGHLQQQLSGQTVLNILGRVIGSGSTLEKACWSLLTLEREAILKQSQAQIETIVKEHPELAMKLILLGTGAPLDPVPKRRKTVWPT